LQQLANFFVFCREGMEPAAPSQQQPYQDYNTNNPANAMILAQQNAGNIISLKQQVDKLNDLPAKVSANEADIATLRTQVSQMMVQQQEYTSKLKAPNITGV